MQSNMLAPEHQLLQRFVGRWSATTRYMGAGGTTYESRADMVGVPVLGGLYVEIHFTRPEQNYVGRRLFGFSVERRLYTSVWLDTMNTTPVIETGAPTGNNAVLELKSGGGGPLEITDPRKTLRSLYAFRPGGNMIHTVVSEVIDGDPRREVKLLDIVYLRL